MPFRKMTTKKYKGINEYYKKSDPDKKTVSFYITFRDLENKIRRTKTEAKNKDEALIYLQAKQAELTRDRADIQKDSLKLHQKVLNNNLSLDEVAKMYHPTKTNKEATRNEAKYNNHISLQSVKRK